MKTRIQLLNHQIKTIGTRGKKQREHVQEVALEVLAFFVEETFNATLATNLVKALGPATQSEKLVNWFVAYGGLSWNSSKKSFGKAKDTVIVTNDDDKPVIEHLDLEAAAAKLWYDMEGTSNVMSPEERLNKRFESAIKLIRDNPELAMEFGLIYDAKSKAA